MLNFIHIIKMNRTILTRYEKKRFIFLILFSFVSAIFDIVGIGAIGAFLLIMTKPSVLHTLPVVSSILPEAWSMHSTLMLLGFIILAAFFLKTILSCVLQKFLIAFCFQVGTRIRMQLLTGYLYAPYSRFISTSTSVMINQILLYASSYSNTGLVSLMMLCVQGMFVLAVIGFLFAVKPLVMSVLFIVFSSIFFVNSWISKNKLLRAGEDLNVSNQEILQGVREGLLSIKEIRVLSKEQFILDRVEKASKINSAASSTIAVFQKMPLYLFEGAMFTFLIGTCLVELSLHVSTQSIVALCGVLVTTGARLLPSLYQVASSAAQLQSNQHTLDSVCGALSEMSQHTQETFLPNAQSHENNIVLPFSIIRLDNISYRYPNADRYALQNIVLDIKRGEAVGIIGASGAGKSTLIDLLLGLLTPTQGTILLDGKPVVNKRAWVKRFAYIPQTIQLLDASLQENITFGEPKNFFSAQRFEEALQMSQLQTVVNILPQGVETIVGENGIRLSGGQRQRVALARAFYHQRDVIVMDEATAALDTKTEQEIVSAINALQKLKTLIIIAHRHSTVANCDVIYRLDHGKLVESGTAEAMIEKAL